MSNPLPWGVLYQGQLRHPAQVYEFLLDYIVFFILWRKRKSIRYDGQLFVWYLVLFSINRSVIELFRMNPSIIGWFSISHLLSLLLIIGAVTLMTFAKRKGLMTLTENLKNPNETKIDLLKDILFIVSLVAVSILIFYQVQS